MARNAHYTLGTAQKSTFHNMAPIMVHWFTLCYFKADTAQFSSKSGNFEISVHGKNENRCIFCRCKKETERKKECVIQQ